MSKTVYIKFNPNKVVYKRKVLLSDVSSCYSTDTAVMEKVKSVKIISVPDVKKGIYVISVLKVIEEITKICPDCEVINIGESDFIIEYRNKKDVKNLWFVIKVILTCVVVFVGSSFTIMAYNNDVAINELFERVYGLAGVKNNGILEISYSVGLTLGISVFYNHFVGKKLSSAPTPVEVSMRSYESDMNAAIVEKASRNGDEQDV